MPERQRAFLATVRSNPKRYGIHECKLCGRPMTQVCIFVPTDHSFALRIGQKSGKTRVVLYGLCDACLLLPDRNERIEAGMVKAAAGIQYF
ncbi:MAG TPA: hypothetical protein VEX68_00595 [Bryobacteraceae bacterium]|nr:hypothetical protein [Bryobacteraceae bacterium]